MSPLAWIMVAGLGVTAVGVAMQAHHGRLLLRDRALVRRRAPHEALQLLDLRILLAVLLGCIHLVVASVAVGHLLTRSPVYPVAADYWAAIARVVVSLLVIVHSVQNLLIRRLLMGSG